MPALKTAQHPWTALDALCRVPARLTWKQIALMDDYPAATFTPDILLKVNAFTAKADSWVFDMPFVIKIVISSDLTKWVRSDAIHTCTVQLRYRSHGHQALLSWQAHQHCHIHWCKLNMQCVGCTYWVCDLWLASQSFMLAVLPIHFGDHCLLNLCTRAVSKVVLAVQSNQDNKRRLFVKEQWS